MVLSTEGDASQLVVRAQEQEGAPPVLQATWRFPKGGATTFQLLHPSRPVVGASLSLDRLLLEGIDRYLDQRIHFEKTGVTTDVPVDRMVADIQAMVRAVAGTGPKGYTGLSPRTVEQLQRMAKVDWGRMDAGVYGGEDQDKYLAIYYYVRAQRQELERLFKSDLQPFAAVEMLPVGVEKDGPRHTADVPTVCRTVFDDQDYLCALDLVMSDTDLVAPDIGLSEQLAKELALRARPVAAVDEVRVRKRDRWLKAELDRINGRIDQLDQRKELWALRDRLDGIEERLDGLDADVDRLRGPVPRPEVAPVPGVRTDVVLARVIFGHGSSSLDPVQRKVLDGVHRRLVQEPQRRVTITGHTDGTGDPARNMVLSEARARAVRLYLMERGVAPERMLSNHVGAGGSSGADAVERRVEIEWLR